MRMRTQCWSSGHSYGLGINWLKHGCNDFYLMNLQMFHHTTQRQSSIHYYRYENIRDIVGAQTKEWVKEKMTPQQLPSGQVSPTLAAIWPSFSGVVASVSSQLQSKSLQSTRNQIQSPLLLYLQEKWYTVGLHNEITLGGNALKRLNILYYHATNYTD